MAGEEVAVLPIVQNTLMQSGTCHYFGPLPVFLYGKYDDYGGLEEDTCVDRALFHQIISENSSIKLSGPISTEKYFEHCIRGELGIMTPKTFAKSLKGGKDGHLAVENLFMKKSVLDKILEEFQFISYHTGAVTEESYKSLLANIEPGRKDVQAAARSPLSVSSFVGLGSFSKYIQSYCEHLAPFTVGGVTKQRVMDLSEEEDLCQYTALLTDLYKVVTLNMFLMHSRRCFFPSKCSSQELDTSSQVLIARLTVEEAKRIEDALDW